jgi:hypothetical protein
MVTEVIETHDVNVEMDDSGIIDIDDLNETTSLFLNLSIEYEDKSMVKNVFLNNIFKFTI